MADYDEMTNDELREELEKRDLKVSGNKEELIARLELNDEEQESAPQEAAPQEQEAPAEEQVTTPESEGEGEQTPPADTPSGDQAPGDADAATDPAADAPEPEADKDVVEAGPDADAEAVAEANADVNTVVDRGSFMGDPAKGDFTTPGNVSRKTEAPNVDLSGSEDAQSDDPVKLGASSAEQAPTSRGTVLTGPEVRGRNVPEGGEELEPIQRPRSSFGGLGPQSQPDNLSDEVSGYVILPDGRRQPVEVVED